MVVDTPIGRTGISIFALEFVEELDPPVHVERVGWMFHVACIAIWADVHQELDADLLLGILAEAAAAKPSSPPTSGTGIGA
eukprot:CAMPEP_0195025660 /NCGR_PEP_ID=MMETSP0326_2-20130528/48315_1 /TAXON_ID=2866 ORGANISM="Crypthecodinium cohnii, Strain Seligo" /NCGR_SAMPLE_ID=MMETSP0326_2 /ASSEMBLY_ACC=CAM_ASM_000348 /LENGTH=80 /DNA_ID=CAMNT_0040047131 /DNA_START=106 /DNA_END=345 /DNA_ORIENTATION=+